MNKLIVAILPFVVAGCTTFDKAPERPATTQQHEVTESGAAAEARRQQERDTASRRIGENTPSPDEVSRPTADPEEAVTKSFSESKLRGDALDDLALLKNPDSALFKRSIYYDFDAYDIRREFQSMLEAHAQFLIDHRNAKVRVEGNCDERGSREYNLALGQRRADSVKRALTLLGVPADQISTVSFGAEKPKASGHDDPDRAENRRSDLVYLGVDSDT